MIEVEIAVRLDTIPRMELHFIRFQNIRLLPATLIHTEPMIKLQSTTMNGHIPASILNIIFLSGHSVYLPKLQSFLKDMTATSYIRPKRL